MGKNCNLCSLSFEPAEERRHVRTHGPETYYTDCFGDYSKGIVHPLTGAPMTRDEFESMRQRLRGSR